MSRVKREIEFPWVSGAKLIVRNGMHGATGNIYWGLDEFADMGFLLHFLRPSDLFVDVGTNVGAYTVLASGVCGARSVAFEPDPVTVVALRRNVGANGIDALVTIVEAALGATIGVTRFTVGLDCINHVANGEANTRTVRMTTLDDALGESPTFMKLDVEGYEAEVVKGARSVLRNPSLIAIETESREIALTLEAEGFSEAFYDPFTRTVEKGRSSRIGWGNNALFIRDFDLVRRRVSKATSFTVLGQTL